MVSTKCRRNEKSRTKCVSVDSLITCYCTNLCAHLLSPDPRLFPIVRSFSPASLPTFAADKLEPRRSLPSTPPSDHSHQDLYPLPEAFPGVPWSRCVAEDLHTNHRARSVHLSAHLVCELFIQQASPILPCPGPIPLHPLPHNGTTGLFISITTRASESLHVASINIPIHVRPQTTLLLVHSAQLTFSAYAHHSQHKPTTHALASACGQLFTFQSRSQLRALNRCQPSSLTFTPRRTRVPT